MKACHLQTVAVAFAIALFGVGAAFSESATADGQVQKIDAASAKITIKHGPIKAFDMPEPMTMVYRVKDPAMLNTVKAGDNVGFDADHDTSGYVITRIEKKK
jgi:Cu(I)/Ag(I) efflux system protein CusF